MARKQVKEEHVQNTRRGIGALGYALSGVIIPLMLLTIIGLSVAPVAALNEGWFYYRHSNIAGAPGGHLRILGGWKTFHTSATVGRFQNKSVRTAMLAVPATCIALLLASALLAAFHLFMSTVAGLTSMGKNKNASKGGKTASGILQLLLTLLAPGLGLLLIAFAIASYIVLAVFTALWTRENLGGSSFVAWPSWAFFLAAAAGLWWLLLAPLTAAASAVAGAHRGMDGKHASDINQGMNQGPDVNMNESYESRDPKRVDVAPVKRTNENGVNGMNGSTTNGLGNNGAGYTNANSGAHTTTTNTSDRHHLDNMNGFVIDHNKQQGGLAERTYQNLV